mmetsp:Transcript_143810/g.365028  ORF Transcript_143810/g.365028 Transcript_143810/m.365028 type:complete len:381 (-) Transcript_143810:31-1173(-)
MMQDLPDPDRDHLAGVPNNELVAVAGIKADGVVAAVLSSPLAVAAIALAMPVEMGGHPAHAHLRLEDGAGLGDAWGELRPRKVRMVDEVDGAPAPATMPRAEALLHDIVGPPHRRGVVQRHHGAPLQAGAGHCGHVHVVPIHVYLRARVRHPTPIPGGRSDLLLPLHRAEQPCSVLVAGLAGRAEPSRLAPRAVAFASLRPTVDDPALAVPGAILPGAIGAVVSAIGSRGLQGRLRLLSGLCCELPRCPKQRRVHGEGLRIYCGRGGRRSRGRGPAQARWGSLRRVGYGRDPRVPVLRLILLAGGCRKHGRCQPTIPRNKQTRDACDNRSDHAWLGPAISASVFPIAPVTETAVAPLRVGITTEVLVKHLHCRECVQSGV